MKPNWPLVIRQVIAATNCDIGAIASHCGVCKSAVEQWLAGVKSPSFTPGWELINAYVANVGRRIPCADAETPFRVMSSRKAPACAASSASSRTA